MTTVEVLSLQGKGEVVSYGKIRWDGRSLRAEEDNKVLKEILSNPVRDRETREEIKAEDNPEAFLANLQYEYRSPYFWVTAPRQDKDGKSLRSYKVKQVESTPAPEQPAPVKQPQARAPEPAEPKQPQSQPVETPKSAPKPPQVGPSPLVRSQPAPKQPAPAEPTPAPQKVPQATAPVSAARPEMQAQPVRQQPQIQATKEPEAEGTEKPEAATSPDVPQRKEAEKYQVVMEPGAAELAKKLFRRETSTQEYAAMAAAPDGADVTVTLTKNKFTRNDTLWINGGMQNEDGTADFYSSMSISQPRFSRGRLIGKLLGVKLEGAQKGQGAILFDRRVRVMANKGVGQLVMHAAGDSRVPGSGNGFYTWAALGCTGIMSREQVAALPKEIQNGLKGSRNIRNLFDLPGGPEAWKKFGWGIEMWFDLSPNSVNRKSLEAYMKRRFGEDYYERPEQA